MEKQDMRVLTLDPYQHGVVINALNNLRNDLIEDKRPTDIVDEVLIKTVDAPSKSKRVKHSQLRWLGMLSARHLGYSALEQYRDPKLAQLHRDYLAGRPLEYMAAIFRRLTDTDEEAMQLALDFYGPMYLLYSVYDAAEEKKTVAPMLAAHIRRFIARIETGYRWNGETDFEGGERLL